MDLVCVNTKLNQICLPQCPGKALDEMIMFDEYHKNQDIKFDKNLFRHKFKKISYNRLNNGEIQKMKQRRIL